MAFLSRLTFERIRHAVVVCAVIAVFTACASAHAQSDRADDWRWVRFGVADGLPSTIVNDVAYASDGTVWAATEGGTAWFDGYRWIAVRDSAGGVIRAPSSYVVAGANGEVLFQSGRALFWVTRREGVMRVERFESAESGWWSRAALHRGEIWVVRVQKETPILSRLSGGRWRSEPWPGRPAAIGRSSALFADRDGRLFLSVGTQVWERRSGDWRMVTPFIAGDGMVTHRAWRAGGEERFVIRSPDSLQGVWASGPSVGRRGWSKFVEFGSEAPVAFDIGADGTSAAVLAAGDFLFCDASGWRQLRAPKAIGTVRSLTFDGQSDVWFATRDGVVLWRRSSERWTQWRTASMAPTNRINGLAISATGEVAAATGEGVAAPDATGSLRADLRPPRTAYTAIAFDPTGRLWIGSGGGRVKGALVRDGSGWHARTDAPGLDSTGLHRIATGVDGSLWLLGLPATPGGTGGVWHVVGNRIERHVLPEPYMRERIYDFAEDSSGTRWFATNTAVLRERGGRVDVMKSSVELGGDRPFSLAAGDSGRVWVGLRQRGAVRLRADLTVDSQTVRVVRPVNQTTVLRAADGRIWAANPDGLWMWNGDAWSSLTRSAGFSTHHYWPVAVQGDDVYAGTPGAGIHRLRIDVLRGARPRVFVAPMGIEDGVMTMRWRAVTERGIVAPEEIESRWRLDGGAWSTWSTATAVAPPVAFPWRRHRFEVEARTPVGVLSAEPATQAFRVPAPAWWRGDLLLLFALLSGLLAWLSVLLVRRRRQQELLSRRVREAERMELVGSFAAGIAHELNNLLTTIGVNAELVTDVPGAESPTPSEEIRRAAQRATGQLKSVLAFTSDRAIVLGDVNLSALLQEQRPVVSALFPSAIQVEWRLPTAPLVVRAEPNSMTAVLRALAEHSREAMGDDGMFEVSLSETRLTEAYRAELGLAPAKRFAEILVAHSGGRITKEESERLRELNYPTREHRVSGLPLVYGLMRRFGAAVQADSAADRGLFRLYFPIVEPM